MKAMIHPELAYAFRRFRPVVTSTRASDAVLAQIDQLLVQAGNAFAGRRYREAIATYERARSVLWKQLFPATVLVESVAWKNNLIPTLVSYSGEWLNVLAIEQPTVGPRPRETVAVDAPVLGLRSAAVEADVVADLESARLLTEQGNKDAALFFRKRAQERAPELVRKLEEASAVAVATPASPGPAVPPGGPAVRGNVERARGLVAEPVSPRFGRFEAAERVDLALRFGGDAVAPVVAVPPAVTVEKRSYAAQVGEEVKVFEWAKAESPTALVGLYEAHRLAKFLPDALIKPAQESDAAVALAHAWYYETALGLAECYHALGDWEAAETWYQRVTTYQFLNTAVEVPYVWSRLATLYRDWGDSLFRADDAAAALPVYSKVVTPDGDEGASALFTAAPLKAAADAAREVLAHLDSPDAVTASPAISGVVFDIWGQLAKIAGGLDFWGHWAENVPIWTFDYLQSVAGNFAQLAIGAERDAMTFWEKADQGELTRTQLTQNVALAQAEREATRRQADAARAERAAYDAAVATADLRAQNARTNAADYTSKSRQWTMHQALSTQLSGGEDGDASQLNALADRMVQGGYSISGDRGTLAAAESLTAARLQREYEVALLGRQAAELDSAASQARAERTAAGARVVAIDAAVNAANVRVNAAAELLDAFDDQRFTPDVWHALGERMNELAQRYLVMSLDIAKRMQRAYNFENDVQRSIIKADYASTTVAGLLAADALMADIQAFTFDLVTSTAPKSQPVRQTISLASRYPFLFETQLRATGRMEFQTTVDDFDSVYPGTYGGRIEYVEVEVDGIVPPRGISGTLINSGISHYRMPSGSPGLKHRVQAREALVLSDYELRTDAIIVDPDRRKRRIFEGAGVASSWTLELPKDVNGFDYAQLVDVRLTVTYEARFDPDLKTQVLAELASRPSIHERQRPIPLRWLHPDAFFAFYGSGVLDLSLEADDFAAFELDPVLTDVSLLVTTSPRARAEGVTLQVTAPGRAPMTVTTGADGIVPEADLAAAAGADALGAWQIVVDADDNPDWVTDGELDLEPVQNIALVVGYSFTPRS
jgi:hypothetical protein